MDGHLIKWNGKWASLPLLSLSPCVQKKNIPYERISPRHCALFCAFPFPFFSRKKPRQNTFITARKQIAVPSVCEIVTRYTYSPDEKKKENQVEKKKSCCMWRYAMAKILFTKLRNTDEKNSLENKKESSARRKREWLVFFFGMWCLVHESC